MQTALVLSLSVFVIVGIWLVDRRRRRLPLGLEARPAMMLGELQDRFFRDLSISPERFAQLWNDVARTFEVPAERIRPSDRLGVELPVRPMFGTTDEEVILAGLLKRRCKELGIEPPSIKPATVDEYVRLLAGVESPPRQS